MREETRLEILPGSWLSARSSNEYPMILEQGPSDQESCCFYRSRLPVIMNGIGSAVTQTPEVAAVTPSSYAIRTFRISSRCFDISDKWPSEE